MKPKPFIPEVFNGDSRYVRNTTDNTVWHQSQTRVLYADTDRSQVVYHSNYLRFFELGRATLMRDCSFPYRQVEESGYVYPIVETGLKYHTPLQYDDLILIHTRPARLHKVKIQFDYVITIQETGAITCTGFTEHCAVNQNGIPVAIDPMTLKLWQNFPT